MSDQHHDAPETPAGAPGTPDVDPAAWSFETKQVHAGQAPDPATNARALPIYQTTSYAFRDTEHAAALFGLAETGNIYTRIMNPTQGTVEQRIAALEGGIGALLVASGQAAETLAILNIASAGDHVVASPRLYGGTYNLLRHTLPKYGITTTFVEDPDDVASWRAAAREETKLFYAETISNPAGDVLDISAVADAAHAAGVPLVVDNTIATPWLIRPLEHGADVVVHSATKYLGGHGTAIGGAVVDGGRFDWAASDRFPGLTTPDPSYHGVVYTDAVGPAAFVTKARVQLLRDMGPAISPFNAFLLAQGIETLSLRMERHVANAQRVAEHLAAHEQVLSVNYAGLPTSPWHANAQRYAPRGTGAVLAFEIDGGLEAGRRFVDALVLHSHVANIGDVRSLVIHPASTTHSQLDPSEQLTTGVTPGLVRLAVGIEGIEDVLADLERGFAAARG
ncbi:bifunctional o-acetylhomoserine/o-acetylserine sulfhydrylase [Kineococcus terrestris]|uniref:bifunctional o-acetylhomoserine/o-acetylserine sulfhydrylase n=1 Tax=Kineococcus terrestris TaxID=2044856 RepID=UPI0034DAF94C